MPAWRGAGWREYLAEAAGLGLFMVSACGFGALLFHPASPAVASVPDPLARRALMGLAMGLTAVGLIHSPWGRRSGAHLNPATTLTFWRLGKVRTADAAAYAAAQLAGGLLGVLVSAWALGPVLAEPAVNYVATVPGPAGVAAAFAAEVLLTFVLMTVVLATSNDARWARFTGLLAGGLVAVYITVESPVSGMSVNPARTLASAIPGGVWTAVWIYLVGPPLGMLAAAELYVARHGLARVLCAKLRHGAGPCPFRCRYGELVQRPSGAPRSSAAVAQRPRA